MVACTVMAHRVTHRPAVFLVMLDGKSLNIIILIKFRFVVVYVTLLSFCSKLRVGL